MPSIRIATIVRIRDFSLAVDHPSSDFLETMQQYGNRKNLYESSYSIYSFICLFKKRSESITYEVAETKRFFEYFYFSDIVCMYERKKRTRVYFPDF